MHKKAVKEPREKMTGVSKHKAGNLVISKTKMGETLFSQSF